MNGYTLKGSYFLGVFFFFGGGGGGGGFASIFIGDQLRGKAMPRIASQGADSFCLEYILFGKGLLL